MATKTPKIMSASEISEARAKLQLELDNLASQEKAAKIEEANKLNAVIDTFPGLLKKILGREVSPEDMLNMVRYKVKNGSLENHSANAGGSGGDRGKRLDEAGKTALKADLLKRAVNKELGLPADQISVIATRAGVTPQTCDGYKPTKEEVATAVAAHKAANPAPAAAPAAGK